MDTSRAEMGSSQTMNSGLTARARAMPLAAGELVGVAVGVLPHQAHVVQQFIDPLAPLLLGGEFGVKIQRLPDDVHDRHTGV